ncbi:delta-9 fatty acid desaturas-like protein [Aspergillus ellipticus CBS 707.79]|uniref:stearoyl-CoA 9-desaturase n=1 Tax=Aspergillus ellipticus CBS 707.79 TaxID=1448320 RepID=A0A319DLH9_9EURO|nr:delta-9 fatty acid desaturas-like protein [Aspergillus ellipticus CBS 707.79]
MATHASNPPPSQGNGSRKVHIADTPITLRNWQKHLDWLNVTMIILIPLYGCLQALWVPLQLKTAIWAITYYFFTGLGITAGYHRLWSHSSYTAHLPLPADPYAANKGLFYSHFGWMLLKQNPQRFGRTDISDLNEDPVVVWQHRHFLKIVLVMGLIFPMLVAGIWGDLWGGFIYAGIIRIFVVQQATFCVNSLAHWLGEQPFDDRNSPRDHVITAFVTLGEGYHNFHHEFPSDYRNAIEWWQYDPTKWAIWVWMRLGLACGLKEFRANEIEKGRVQQLQKKVDRERALLDWGVPLRDLPVWEWEEYVQKAKTRGLIVVAGVVHDVTDFVDEHPGGKRMIQAGVGKDATAMFNGGVYYHSNAAHNLLSMMRVGVIRGGSEVEVWKRSVKEG